MLPDMMSSMLALFMNSPLGHTVPDQWELLWTKSVYAIKAARSLRMGQLVSGIAGLNCLSMKKRMLLTLRGAHGSQLAFTIMPRSVGCRSVGRFTDILESRRHLM